MKKLLFLLPLLAALFVFASCSDDENGSGVSTFTIINNSERYETSLEYLDGSLYEVVVFEYDESNNNIGQINLDDIPCEGGTSGPVQVQESCDKVQVSFKMLPPESPAYDLSANDRLYVASLSVINKGGNVDIVIDGNTMTTSNPSVRSRANGFGIKFLDCLKSIQ